MEEFRIMEHLTGRPQGDRIDAVKNSRILAPWWPRISMSWVKRRGFCSHGCFSILFLFSALNEGWLLVVLRIVQKSSKKKSQEPSFAWKSWATCNNSTWKASILDVGRKNGPCCKRHQKKNKCCHVLPNKKSKVQTWGRQQVTSSWVYASSVINSDYWMILTQVKRTYPETSSEGYTKKLVVGRIWAN